MDIKEEKINMSYLDDEELEATRKLHGLIKDQEKEEDKKDEANQKDTRLYRI